MKVEVPKGEIQFVDVNFGYSGAYDMVLQDIRKACDMAMVTEFLEAKHVSPEFELAQGGANLSGGQRQRMSLARAFIKDAFIYLFNNNE